MFEDVGDAGRVVGGGAERDAEDLVFVGEFDRDQFRACFVVPVDPGPGIDFVDPFVAQKGESVHGAARYHSFAAGVNFLPRFGDGVVITYAS